MAGNGAGRDLPGSVTGRNIARGCFLGTRGYAFIVVLLVIVLLPLVPAVAATHTLCNGHSIPQNITDVPSSGRSFSLSINSALLAIDNQRVSGCRGAVTPSGLFFQDRFIREVAGSRYLSGQQIGIAAIDGGTVKVAGTNGSLTMKLAGIGRPDAFQTADVGKIRASSARLDIVRPGSVEWYVMGDAGIKQGMTVDSRPPGNGTLEVSYILAGDLQPILVGQTLVFFNATGPVVNYGGLAAYDAAGRKLPASLALSSGMLTWQIDDRNAVYPIVIDPWITSQKATLTASDAASGAWFGNSVAISGNTAVIGATAATVNSKNYAGQAYVFTNNGGTWSQTAILNASDVEEEASFGQSMAISDDGDTVLIGAYHATANSKFYAGQAYVFTNSGGAWSQTAILNASDAGQMAQFGNSAAISGDGNTVVIGANWASVNSKGDAGQAYIFTNNGGTWSQTAILNASDAAASVYFGYSTALSGDANTVIIGATGAEVNAKSSAGQAYVFTKNGGTWSQTAILNATDAAASAYFGYSSAITDDGDTAVIGAYSATVRGKSEAGQAYVFTNNGGTWSQTAILNATDAAASAYFGYSSAISGDGGIALIGADKVTVNWEGSAGKVYVFKRSGGTWSQAVSMSASDATESAYFGNSVAISDDGGTAAIGAYGFNSKTGKAYVFNISSSAPKVYGITPSSWPNTSDKKVIVSGNGFNSTYSPVVNLTRTGYSNITIKANTWDLVDTSAFYVSIPSGKEAGVWNVTVINPDGEEGTNPAVTFTVTAPPILTGISPASGKNTAKTLVTITGSQFSSTAAPVVNLTKSGYSNITLTGTNLSSTSFTVAVPPDVNSGAWNVVVVNPDGLEGTNPAVTFTVTVPPRLTGISPTCGANATKTLVTITGSRFSTAGAPVVNLTSTGNSNITMTATNLSSTSFTVTVPNHNIEAVWNVTVINPDRLEGTNASVTFSTTDPPPIADFSFGPTTGLAPLAVTFTDNSINVPESWSWDFGDGDSTGATLQNPVHTYTKPGIYSVSLSATNYLGTGTKTVQKAISVNALATQTAVLNAGSDAVTDDRFGSAVALSRDGNTALAGGAWITLGATPPGKVWVFKKNGGTWSRSQVLIPSNSANSNMFGTSLALSDDGNTALIGADNTDIGTKTWAGQVYVFTNSGGSWSQSQILNASDNESSGHFGESLVISRDGNTALIGAYMATVGGKGSAGKVYVFRKSEGLWFEQQILTTSDAEGSNFGYSIALSDDGNTALIGAPDSCYAPFAHYPGKAYVFTRNGAGVWSEQQILTPSNPNDEAMFGRSVAISGDGNTAVIGAPLYVIKSPIHWSLDTYPGQAYIFTRNGAGVWSEQQILNDWDDVSQRNFGISISISDNGNTALIGHAGGGSGHPGRAYIFQKDGDSWSRTHTLKAPGVTDSDNFGGSVALRGTTALVGAEVADYGTVDNAGQAYFFTISALAPVVSGISPVSGTNTAAKTVTITGTSFNINSAPVVKLTRTGYADVTLGVVSGTSTSLVRTVPAYTVAGTWNVVVVNPDGQEGTTASVTYTAISPPPSVTSVIPATGINTSAAGVEITGTGFNTTMPGGTTVNLTRSGYTNISITGITPASVTRIALDLPITHAEAGIWHIVVINPDMQESVESVPFRITEPNVLQPPSVTFVSPATGLNTGTVNIVITGTGLNATMPGGTVVNLTRTGYANISVNGITPASATSLSVSLPVTHADAGTWYLVVVNPDGQESMERVAFVITSPVPTTSPTTTTALPVTYSAGSDDDSSPATIQADRSLMTVAVNIGGNSNIEQAVVTGTKLNDLIVTGTVLSGPGRAVTAAPGTIFQYISILPARYTAITKATLAFSVPQSWLDSSHLTAKDIALYRYAGGTWTALPTTVTKTENGQVYLTATSPGFSLFAIAGTTGASAIAAPVTVQTSSEGSGTGSTAGAIEHILTMFSQPGTSRTYNSSAAPGGPDAGFPVTTGALISAGCVLLIGSGWWVRRWWRRRQNPTLFEEY